MEFQDTLPVSSPPLDEFCDLVAQGHKVGVGNVTGPRQIVGDFRLDFRGLVGQNQDPSAEIDGLLNVVGDENDRGAHLPPQADQLILQLEAEQR